MGDCFRLIQSTLGVISENGKEVAICIPPAASVLMMQPLVTHPDDAPHRQVTVYWEGTAVSVFADRFPGAFPAGASVKKLPAEDKH
jgi:hypothetical protein